MQKSLPTVLVPGLRCSARLYAPQVPALWQFGPVVIANHMQGNTIAEIATSVLEAAPPRFALAGLSMGGYIAFEMLRQSAHRIASVALLDTSARPEAPEQTARRRQHIALTEAGRYDEVTDLQFPLAVHPTRHQDEALRAEYARMGEETGPEVYLRHQHAIMARADSRPDLGSIRCPTLVLVGDGDVLTPPEHAREIAAGIDGAHLVIVPECGHLSTLERPEEVRKALIDWLGPREATPA
jgi:pimeloyl-ACP methyl ester carboxylesterase